ncbi:adenylosuccinate synthetase [Patescibacteria group bacterium]
MRITRKMRRIEKQLSEILLNIGMLIVTGTCWGDEGKGKIVDLLSKYFKVSVRFSGGAGAGHTLVTPDNAKIIGHLIPCGIARRIMCVLARGVFFDLRRFVDERRKANKALKGKLPRIAIDHMSPLWTPWHQLFEAWVEYALRGGRIQTTGKAIGPLEGLFKLRVGLLVGHLFLSEKELRRHLQQLYRVLKPDFDAMVAAKIIRRKDIPLPKHVADEFMKLAPKIKDCVTDTAFLLSEEWKKGTRIIFEAAQAPGLDPRAGTWPFVSAGNSTAAGAPIGTLLPLAAFAKAVVVSVAKVLPTRVGAGPFPSEIWDRIKSELFALRNKKLFRNTRARIDFLAEKRERINAGVASQDEWAQYFQVLGYELGATTGRGRSIGWMDLQWLSYANRVNGTRYLALTRLDMLSGLKQVPVVVGYRHKGRRVKFGAMPPPLELDQIEPIIEMWDCWKEDISGCSTWNDLPAAAKRFIWRIERALGVPVLLIGTGPGRDAIIVRESAIRRRITRTPIKAKAA